MGRTTGANRKVKDPNRPKRPTSAYFYFVASKREEAARKGQKITKVAEWTKQVSAIWRELTDKDKIGFDKQAATDKARYEREMQVYSGKKPKDANKPKRPQSAYFLFLAEFRERNKQKFTGEGAHKDLIRAAGEAWNNLNSAEKGPYEHRAEGEKKKYEEAMKVYNAGVAAAGDDDDDEDDDE
jgi:high mobility group protein B1/high mobility group protein B3